MKLRAQLEAGLSLYDNFDRWSRDAVEEVHVTRSKRSSNDSTLRRASGQK
jgi:hypothetical protein